MATADNFTGKVVSLIIMIVLVALVAIPIITSMIGKNGEPNAGDTYPIQEGTTLATIVEILPIFLVLAILLVIVKWFLDSRA